MFLYTFFSPGSGAEYHFEHLRRLLEFYTFETTREKLIFQIVMFYFQHFKQIRVLLLTIFNEELRITIKKLWLLFSMLILTGIGRNLLSRVEWFTGMAYVGLLIGSGGTTQFNVFIFRKRSCWWWLDSTFVSMDNFGMTACHPAEKDENGNPRGDLWPP